MSSAAHSAAASAGGAAAAMIASQRTQVNPAIATTALLLDNFVGMLAKSNGWIAKHGTPANNTGISPAIDYIKVHQPLYLNKVIVSQVIPTLPGLMGGYPLDSAREHGVNIFMCVMFGLLGFGALSIFITNKIRKHNFWWMFGVFGFCACKVVGYATRYKFSEDITFVDMGIVSVVFLQVPQLVMLSMNHMLAHRIFTWRHPETGNSWWINLFFNIIYGMIIAVVVMAVIGQVMPYTRILTEHDKIVCQNVTMAAAILNLVYALIPFCLVAAAYMFKPGTLTAEPWKSKDVDRVLPPVYQANWIEKTNIFYYVPRGVQHQIYRDEPAAQAIRVIPSREVPAGGVHDSHTGPSTHPNSPSVLIAIAVIMFAATIFLLNTCFRVAAVFGTYRGNHPTAVITKIATLDGGLAKYEIPFFPFRPECLWVFYGGLEGLVILVYLLARIDLRFYIPDMAKRAGANPHPYNGSEYNEAKQLEESA